MSRRITEQVQHLPFVAGAEDSHGNPIESWGPAESVGIYALDPGSTSEPRRPGSDRVIVEPTMYGPYGLPFEPHDRCVARGETFEVEGVTRDWKHPGGLKPGSVVSLRRVAG
jgi:hypothetical protein